MSTLTLALAVALVASLALSAWLWRRLARATTAPAIERAPPADPFSPLQHPLFQSAVAALDSGLIVVDLERQIRLLNRRAEELLAPAVDTLGQGLIVLLRDHQADALVAETLHDGEVREMAMKPVASGRTLRVQCSPIAPNGQTIGALLLIRDITQLSMLERSRRDLVANVSHELRTPLASLKLLVETLQSEPPPEVARRMLGQMAQEVDAVTQLVDELHELSQIESGRVTLKLAPTPIRPVVERALERIKPQADRKRIAIAAEFHDTAACALIDGDRVGQVLLNLLHNAVKFSPPGGQVTVRTALVHHNGDAEHDDSAPGGLWLQVSVIDTGIGIPAQELPRIFERFYKVDRARTRNAGGTGLGLAIAKHLVEGHGGRLWASSVEGQGSTFSFTLPAA